MFDLRIIEIRTLDGAPIEIHFVDTSTFSLRLNIYFASVKLLYDDFFQAFV